MVPHDDLVRLLREAVPTVEAMRSAANAAEAAVRAEYLNRHPVRGRLRAIRRHLTRRN